MTLPKELFVLHQPPYPVPCVFDLNERGMFSTRPPVTRPWGLRVLVNTELAPTLQLRRITERPVVDPVSGRKYPWRTAETFLNLDNTLTLDPQDLAKKVPDTELCQAITAEYSAWHTAYLPRMEDGTPDGEALKRKLSSGLADRKAALRKELVRRNTPWVHAALPRLIQDFKRGLYLRVADTLYADYQARGGQETEEAFIRKILLFQRIYDINGTPASKPDGTAWQDEDETWDCWVGFAGDEEEAKRVCRTMEAVLRPLKQTMDDEAPEFKTSAG